MDEAYRFGRFELRPAERALLADGQAVPLGARAFDVLLALVDGRDRVVTKNDLLDRVWAGLVVEENNLQVQVSSLRKWLGVDAIKTIPGRGYRFTLPLTPAALPVPAARPALPARMPDLVGRDAELAQLLQRLDTERLVSLLGAGGIGKTSLALAAAKARAAAWRDGVAWVDLAPLADAALVPGALAQALGLQLDAPQERAALAEALAPLQLLLVLDNAEHLLEAVAALAQELLQAAPGLRLLVTSQAPLHLAAERPLRLDALAVPAPDASALSAQECGAVALFARRAAAADRRFALDDHNVGTVVEICRRLDGLPLALELAAARLPLLGLRGVAERLDERFQLLGGGARDAPTRQQTLLAALEWSLGLLPELERRVFERLAVFSGGFALAMAQATLVGEGVDDWALLEALSALVERSLLGVAAQRDGDVPRYALTESARALAQQRLAQDPATAEALRARHARALRRHFESAGDDWLRMNDTDWLARYEPELGNLRLALQWAQVHDGPTLVALVGAAAPLWHHLSLQAEARRWHELSEPLVQVGGVPPALAAPWWRAAQWAWSGVSAERARAAARWAEATYRALDDAHGLYAQLAGAAGMWQETRPEADAALQEALALERPDWPPRERAWGQRARADVARAQGRLRDSRDARHAELVLRAAAGDERGRLRALSHLVDLAMELGDHAEAVALAAELVGRLRGGRDPAALCAETLHWMAALLAQGDLDAAQAIEPEARALAQQLGQADALADVQAWLALLRGEAAQAAQLAGWADAALLGAGGSRSARRRAIRERVEALLLQQLGIDAAREQMRAGARLPGLPA